MLGMPDTYPGRHGLRRSRLRTVGLVMALALVAGQGISTIAANAAGASRVRDDGSTSDTTKVGGDGTNVSSRIHDEAPEVTAVAASTYDGLSFRLQGCKGEAGLLPNGAGLFICDDSLYTDGNLGKGWNELDLVPHRIIITAGNSAPATQTYAFDIAADNLDSGKTGYDFIEGGFEATSSACQNVSVGPQQTVGTNPQQIYREITVTQAKNTTCQLDLYIRLGLGAHLYPGSSLHSNLLNDQETTAGIGNKENSIPVNEIQPQELSKTETATQSTGTSWSIDKFVPDKSLDFGDTCAVEAPTSKTVFIAVSWTKTSGATGNILIDAAITATNPAHRNIDVSVTDTIYEGAIGSTTEATELVGQNPKTFTDTVDAYADQQKRRSDIGEMAQLSAVESLTSLIGEKTGSLFGATPEDVQKALGSLTTKKNFSLLTQEFFARFLQRYLSYFLSRELSNHVGPNRRFANIYKYLEFNRALDLYCHQITRIVEEFAGYWFTEANNNGGINISKARIFTYEALKKIRDELGLDNGSNGR